MDERADGLMDGRGDARAGGSADELSADQRRAVTMWVNSLGDMNEALRAGAGPEMGDGGREHVRLRTIKSDWKADDMPRERAEIPLGIELTLEEFEELAWGHYPEEMEDHWFMYFDGEAFCFHRSWTGVFVYRVHVRRLLGGEQAGYVLDHVTANRDKE